MMPTGTIQIVEFAMRTMYLSETSAPRVALDAFYVIDYMYRVVGKRMCIMMPGGVR